MDCGNQVGVRNVVMKFFDCDNNRTYGPVVHEISGEEQPSYKTCPYENEAMTGGYTRRSRGNQMMTLSVIRNLGIPLAVYQGCGAIDITVEHFNGLIMTGLNGSVTEANESDAHEVSMTVIFDEIDELLPQQLPSQAA